MVSAIVQKPTQEHQSKLAARRFIDLAQELGR